MGKKYLVLKKLKLKLWICFFRTYMKAITQIRQDLDQFPSEGPPHTFPTPFSVFSFIAFLFFFFFEPRFKWGKDGQTDYTKEREGLEGVSETRTCNFGVSDSSYIILPVEEGLLNSKGIAKRYGCLARP